MSSLILKRASASRPSGQWNDDDFDVLADGTRLSAASSRPTHANIGITAYGGAAVWPLAARAQQAKVATIGLLGTGSAAAQSQWTAAFVQRMRALGWVDGRNLTIEYRWAEGRTERFVEVQASSHKPAAVDHQN